MGDFAEDTRVEGSDGTYCAALSEDWNIWGPNGGYLAAIALRAAGAASGLPRPASFTCHFLSIAEFRDVEIRVTALRAAKRAASHRVSIAQDGRPILEAIVWTTDRVAGLEHVDVAMPDVAAPSDLPSVEDVCSAEELEQRNRFWDNLEERPVEPWVPWSERRAGRPVFREWFRFRPRATFEEDTYLDAARSLLLIDTMGWPAACRSQEGDFGFIAPSLDVAVRFHDEAPAEPWLLCDARAPIARSGLIGTEVATWSPDGRLLASGGSQLFCRPAPPRT